MHILLISLGSLRASLLQDIPKMCIPAAKNAKGYMPGIGVHCTFRIKLQHSWTAHRRLMYRQPGKNLYQYTITTPKTRALEGAGICDGWRVGHFDSFLWTQYVDSSLRIVQLGPKAFNA